MTKISQITRTYKFVLRPNKRQHQELRAILEQQRLLYNGCLEHRIGAYQKAKKSISYFSQCKELAELRQIPEFSNVPSNLQRATLKRLDLAFQAFYRRVKRGDKAGFPRFKGSGWWNSFGFNEFCGIRLIDNRLLFKGVTGGLRVHLHRSLPRGKFLSCQLRRDPKGWSICLQIRVDVTRAQPTGKHVGIDMGLSSLAVMSTGEVLPNPRHTQRFERQLRVRQRHLSRCRRGSSGRQKARDSVARLHMKIRNCRKSYLHQASAKLVRENDVIAVEKLNVKEMAAGMLAKSVNDAGWAMFKQMLSYKAEGAGRKLIEVDPRNTTQACSGCGVIVPKGLGDRWHECHDCGLSLDRDLNAARNVLGRSGSRSAQDKAVANICA